MIGYGGVELFELDVGHRTSNPRARETVQKVEGGGGVYWREGGRAVGVRAYRDRSGPSRCGSRGGFSGLLEGEVSYFRGAVRRIMVTRLYVVRRWKGVTFPVRTLGRG